MNFFNFFSNTESSHSQIFQALRHQALGAPQRSLIFFFGGNFFFFFFRAGAGEWVTRKENPAENIIRLAGAGQWVTRKKNPAENIIRLAGTGQWTA